MSVLPPDPDLLDPELRALFDAAEGYSDMPASAPGHILAKVGAGLLAVPLVTAAATATHAPGAVHGALRATALQQVKRAATWVAFGAGAISGAAGYAAIERAAVHSAPVAALATAAPVASVMPSPSLAVQDPAPTVSVPMLSVPAAASATTAPASATAPSPSSSPSPSPSHGAGSEDGELAAERAQLEVARTALARGQAAAALTVLQADAAARPHGRLAEERDSMTIQALGLAGRSDEARARATTFTRRYPRSLFLPVVQAAIAGGR